jgi:hypothetical protein
MGRRSNVQDFLTNFNMAFNLANKVGDSIEAGRDQQELRQIAQAKPKETQGFTAEQGAELQRAADSGQYDIGYDDARKAYTVTPKADPTQVGAVAQQGVTDFLGNRTAGAMTDDQVGGARQRAMAGVVSRRDPVAGVRMLREQTQADRDDQRFGWEKGRAEREQRLAGEVDAEKAGAKALDDDVGSWMGTRLTGPDGQKRAATVDDHLAATQYRASKLMEAGKVDAAGQAIKEFQAGSFAKIQLDTAQRDQALPGVISSLNAGDFTGVRDFYNRFVPDGSKVTDVRRDKSGQIVIERETESGKKLQPTVLKDASQLTATLATFKDPMALYNWSQGEFRNQLALKADARADRADGRAAAAAGRGQADDAAKADAAVALFKERNPNATQAEISAVRQGILSAVPKSGGYKVEAGDVATLLGIPATGPDGRPLMDPLTGRQVVNRDPQKERELFEFMQREGITDTNEGLARFMVRKQGGQSSAPKLAKGQVVDGYEFLGGDPKNPKSWRQTSGGKVQ